MKLITWRIVCPKVFYQMMQHSTVAFIPLEFIRCTAVAFSVAILNSLLTWEKMRICVMCISIQTIASKFVRLSYLLHRREIRMVSWLLTSWILCLYLVFMWFLAYRPNNLMKVYHLIGNFIAADRHNNYLIPSYSDHLLLGFFNVSNILSFYDIYAIFYLLILTSLLLFTHFILG